MYAIVRTGGKQYRVEEGRSLDVELLSAEEGTSVELDNVLMIADDGEVTVGTPIIEGARVMADVESHGRQKKIIVFKFKAKVRTRKKTGHRQHFTRLAVTEILRPGQESKVAKPKRKPRKSAAKAPADAGGAEGEASSAAPPAEKGPATKKAAPKRRTRKPAVAKAPAATDVEGAAAEKAKPKRRTRKPAAAKAEAGADDTATAEKKPARKRPSRRATKKADEDKE